MNSGVPASVKPHKSTLRVDEDLAEIDDDASTTDGVPPRDRLDHFDHVQMHSDHPMHVISDAPETFVAHARTLELGAVNLVDLCCSPARVVRTPRLVRQLDPELVSVLVVRSGRLVVTQAGRAAVLGPGDLAL